jgi:hypothetical protein
MIRTLTTLFLLFSLHCTAATIYKSVDAKGRVSFSDQPPVADSLIEVLEYTAAAPTRPAGDAARLAEMRETTDRMAADRREREVHRAQLRSLRTEHQTVHVQQEESYYYPIYRGRRSYRPGLRAPHHKPLRPLTGGRAAVVSNYPAKLVRQHYSSVAARVFNPQPNYRPRW